MEGGGQHPGGHPARNRTKVRTACGPGSFLVAKMYTFNYEISHKLVAIPGYLLVNKVARKPIQVVNSNRATAK